MDAKFALQQITEKRRDCIHPTFILLKDHEKAIFSINREKILHILRE
jgi:hypothetical protein